MAQIDMDTVGKIFSKFGIDQNGTIQKLAQNRPTDGQFGICANYEKSQI